MGKLKYLECLDGREWKIAILVFLAWAIPLLFIGSPTMTDYNSFYAAGRQVLEGTPSLAYDAMRHFSYEQIIMGSSHIPYSYFFYPPPMLLLVTPFSLLPYGLSFYLWGIVQIVILLIGGRMIAGWRHGLAALLFPSVAIAFSMGQNSILTAGLLAIGTGALLGERKREVLAGVAFGCLCYKPHLALMIPLALVAGRYWKTFIIAGLTVVFWSGLATLFFHFDIWSAWWHAFSSTNSAFNHGLHGMQDMQGLNSSVPSSFLINLPGWLMMWGVEHDFAMRLQYAVMVGLGMLIVGVWGGGASPSIKGMILVLSCMLAAPIILYYDNALMVVALMWLWSGPKKPPYGKLTTIVLMSIALLGKGASVSYGVPLTLMGMLFMIGMAFLWEKNDEARL